MAFYKIWQPKICNTKRSLIILPFIGFLVSCGVDKSIKTQFEINQILKSGKRFFVEDSSQYSPQFISELRTLDVEYDSVRLIGKYLIMNKSDTCLIPTELPINKMVYYQATKSDTVYKLGLKRINFTNIEYDFRVNNKLIKTGQVVLPATFYLGSEFTKLDDEELISLTQYFDTKEIWTCIKIEYGNAKRIDFYIQSDTDSTKNFKNVPILTQQ